MRNLIRGVGGAENAKDALDYFRAECKKAGFAGLHLMSLGAENRKVPIAGNDKPAPEEVSKYYGYDSMSTYNWTGVRNGDYITWRTTAMARWDTFKKEAGTFFPIVSTGWDNNPRWPKEKTTKTVTGKSPVEYEKSLRMAKDWADKNIPAGTPKLILINAWNEWTEGEYLEPDKTYGYDYLNATARVFGGHGQAKD